MMRYLTVVADFSESALRDDFIGPIDPADLGLSKETQVELRRWNDAYRELIPLSMEARASLEQKVEKLDEKGKMIAMRVREELGDAKVRYFSEGRLSYLTP